MKLNHIPGFVVAAICFACSTDDHTFASRDYASVETGEVTDINENGSTLNGEFLGLGTLPIKDYGFLYNQQHANTLIADAERVSLGATVQTRFSGVADHGLENGITFWYRGYAIVGDKNLVVYGVEKTFIAKGSLPPSITEIVPPTGKPGDVVVINGSGFSDRPYTANITFDGIFRFATKTSATSITCAVPFLPPGEVDVVVKLGANGVPSAPKKFTITN